MPVSSKFQICWKLLLGNEGGFVVDNGGATKWGVTARVAYNYGYRGAMQELPQDLAEEIAEKEYWQTFGCENLPTPLAFQILDTAYNGGHPIQWLQQSLGVAVDGQMGPATTTAALAADVWKVVALFNAYRLEYLASLKQPLYANGRMNRIASNLRKGDLNDTTN